ncbi:unnamed protein product [Closterium sp. NIES-54]
MAHYSFAVKTPSLGSAAARSRFPKSCSTGSVNRGAATSSSSAALSPLVSPFAPTVASPFAATIAPGDNYRHSKPILPTPKPSSQASGSSGITHTEAASIARSSVFREYVSCRDEALSLDSDDEEYTVEDMASQARMEATRLAVLGSRRGSVHIQRESFCLHVEIPVHSAKLS